MHCDNLTPLTANNQQAKQFLVECNFNDKEVEQILTDILPLHSCHTPENTPKTIEGKVMATADAVVHITSDFYKFGMENRIFKLPLPDLSAC